MLRRSSLLLVSLLAVAPLAAAQPAPVPPPPPPGGEPAPTGIGDQTPPPTPTPPPAPEPAPAPAPPPPPVHHAEHAEHADLRPDTLTFAIGAGYAFTTMANLQTPNVVSTRLRLASGLTFEPELIVENSSSSNTPPSPAPSTTDTTTTLTLGTLVRYPVIKHGRADFELLGSAALAVIKNNPDGDNNDVTNTVVEVGWGIGIGYWLSSHWQLSFSATNPLVEFSQQSMQVGAGMDTKTSTTQIGVVYDPAVMLMIHLYN